MNNVLQVPLNVPGAWAIRDLDAAAPWRVALTRDEAEDIARATMRIAERGLEATAFVLRDFPLPVLGPRLGAVAGVLEGGRGFTVLRGIPVERWTEEETRIALWGMGLHIGRAMPQDKAGSLLHDVRATHVNGIRATRDGRGYRTSHELFFHNDGADAFALLCRKAARAGGTSRLVSAVEAFNRVLKRRPDLALVLQQPFPFDARMQNPWGLPFQLVPIFSWFRGGLCALYKRYYIELSQRMAEAPRLSDVQIEAMDLLDEVLEDPDLALEFNLEPGDLEIASNHVIFHARKGYVDHPEPEERRHLLRIWLGLPNGRPLPPAFRHTREFGRTYEYRHAAPRSVRPG